MIRKIYIDILRRRLASRDVRWLSRAFVRYPLVRFSALARRPFCGPILGTLVTNYSCNCRCAMCDLPAQERVLRERGLAQMDAQGLKSVLNQFQDLGVLGVGFTGGEPLLNPDIMDLLAHCRGRGMLTHLNTNGLMLDSVTAAELVRIGIDSVNVSLDGADPKTHDGIRGVAGAFDAATEALRRVLAARTSSRLPRVKAVMVVQRENIEQIQEVARLAASLGADCVEYIPEQRFGNEGRAIADQNLAARAQSATESLLQSAPLPLENSPRMLKLLAWTLKGHPSPLRCYAGYNSITVDCHGRVFPCLPWLNWSRSSSYLRENSLLSLWSSRDYALKRREAFACRDCTLNCQTELNLLFNPLRRIKRAP